jgi:hypothetical protein
MPPAARFCVGCGSRVGPDHGAISWDVAERRYFGVLPGRRFFRAASTRVARLWAIVLGRIRQSVAVVAARADAELQILALRRDAAKLSRERASRLRELGEAVYQGGSDETEQARARVAELDTRLATTEEQMSATREHLARQLESARREGGATEVEQPPFDPPGPVIVPEPEPVPLDPPGPVIVPEPEPVPHEPPGPVIVPEPQPPQAR